MSEHNAPPSFENFLEHDLERLAREMESKRGQSETKDFDQKELIKEAIRAFPELKHDVERGGSPGGGAVAAGPADDDPRSPLPPYAQNASAETKLEIEYLLEIAVREGIGKALAASQKSSYFVQDAFHDALAGRLYPALQKRGAVK